LREELRLLQVCDRVDLDGVGLIDFRALGVRVILHHLVEEVGTAVVAEECEDLFAVVILPERRTDARRRLGRLRNLRHGEAGLFSPARRELRAHNLRRGSGVTTGSRDVRALTLWQGWNDVY